jgi:hypothetical protein
MSKAREDRAFAEGASVMDDREAVAAYLKGASSSVSPPDPKPNFSILQKHRRYRAPTDRGPRQMLGTEDAAVRPAMAASTWQAVRG